MTEPSGNRLPANNTGRVFLDYTDGLNQHSMSIRWAAPSTAVDALGDLFDWLALIQGQMPNTWRVRGARFALQGSDLTLPLPLTPAQASFAGNSGIDLNPQDAPREYRWVGRSASSGRRVSLSVYGLISGTPADYRFTQGEHPLAAPAVFDDLNAFVNSFLAIDGSAATWSRYINVQYNSYWEREARS